jgi:hypothetical protein
MPWYEVRERVLTDYVYHVEAPTGKEAKRIVQDCEITDGEAESQDELGRCNYRVRLLAADAYSSRRPDGK